jgi:uncharacterized membrane protein
MSTEDKPTGTREIRRAEAAEARAEEREARDALANELRDRLDKSEERVDELQKANRSQSRWIVVLLSSFTLLLLLFIGTMIGVVGGYTVNVPGLGTVNGGGGADPVEEPAEPAWKE